VVAAVTAALLVAPVLAASSSGASVPTFSPMPMTGSPLFVTDSETRFTQDVAAITPAGRYTDVVSVGDRPTTEASAAFRWVMAAAGR
jgi:hypothetical protein